MSTNDVEEKTKTCGECGETKSVDEFNRRKASKTDGREYRCKTCKARYAKRHEQVNPYQAMVKASRSNDKKHGRTSELEYISVQRISDMNVMQNGLCYYCGVEMVSGEGINRKTNRDAMTVERVDESIAHVVENCVLVCHECNMTRGGKSHDDMVTYGKGLKNRTIAHCIDCKQYMSPSMFDRCKDRKNGLQQVCKRDDRKRRRERRERKRRI